MRRINLIGIIAGLTMLGTAAAQAAPGFSTANVNIRTGPDTDFPSVGVIPEGDDLDIRGCLKDESWCDVIWAGNRGWVFSEYLAPRCRASRIRNPDRSLRGTRVLGPSLRRPSLVQGSRTVVRPQGSPARGLARSSSGQAYPRLVA